MVDKSLNYGRSIIDKFSKNMDLDNVLDIGAGTGVDLNIVKNNNANAKQFAVECFPDFIKEMEAKDITVYPLDIEKDSFPFENESLDMVIGNQIFEHVKEVFWIFHEISRTLKVGGHIVLGVPNLASLHNRFLLSIGRQPTSIKTASAHVRGYTKRDLLTFLNECFPGGYELESFAGSNFYPFPPLVAKPLASIFPTMAWGIFMKLKKVKNYDNSFLEFPEKEGLQTNFYVGK